MGMRRDEIFERDGRRCVYCGEIFPVEELTLDHVQPRSRGGDGSEGNLVTACRGCNTRKGGAPVWLFLRNEPATRERVFAHAVHVWPRILRAVQDDIRKGRDAGGTTP